MLNTFDTFESFLTYIQLLMVLRVIFFVCVACANVKHTDSAIWILSILQKQKQHVSVMGSNNWLNMGLMPFYIYAYKGVWLWYMSLPVKWQEQSYCNCLCIRASQTITLLWFWESYVSTVYLWEYFKISDNGQTEIWKGAFSLHHLPWNLS